MNLIKIENLNFKYGKQNVLNNINLTISSNQKIGIIGRNGGGKTTLIKIILGYLNPSSGKIIYNNIKKEEISYLPQLRDFDNNFPITVYDLILSGLINKNNFFKKYSTLEKETVNKLMIDFNIYDLKNNNISDLSGGQLQNALIARALVSNPKLLILDEPDSFLDINYEKALYEKLNSLQNTSLLIISHELEDIYDLVDSIIIIENEIKVYENKTDYKKEFQHGVF